MNGAYDLEGVIWHQHSNQLMKKILELWPEKEIPIADLGCGHNFYVSVLRYAGYKDAIGFDLVNLGSQYMKEIDVSKRDLRLYKSHETFLGEPARVICLEVGEHVPFDRSAALLDNICSFMGDVIMSWAIPGQSGVGHINCQDNEWVKGQMGIRGYLMVVDKTVMLRHSVAGCHCSWFRNTLMYFRPMK